MNIVLIANIISFVGAVIMVVSGLLKTKRTILIAQNIQFAIQAVGNILLGDFSGAVKLTLNDTELNTQIYIQISYLQKDRGILHACYYIVLALVVLSIYPMLPKAGDEKEQNAQKEGQR